MQTYEITSYEMRNMQKLKIKEQGKQFQVALHISI